MKHDRIVQRFMQRKSAGYLDVKRCRKKMGAFAVRQNEPESHLSAEDYRYSPNLLQHMALLSFPDCFASDWCECLRMNAQANFYVVRTLKSDCFFKLPDGSV